MNTKLKQEVMNLLPWYHLGKLTDEEKKLVENAFQEDPTLKQASLFEKEMMMTVQADNTLLDGSMFDATTSRLDNVLAQIDLLEQPEKNQSVTPPQTMESPATQKPGILSQLKDYFDNLLSGNSHSFTYAVFAALTVVQLALLVLFIVPSDNIGNEPQTTYDLASFEQQQMLVKPNSSAPQMVLLIEMEKPFKAEGFSEMLGNNVEVDILPDSSGYYRIRVNKQLSAQEIEELTNELSKKHGKIWIIGEDATPQ